VTTAMSQCGAETAGDRIFGRFYEAHYPEVLAYCRRRLGPQAAEDASAEVFAAAWRKWSTVPKGDGALPWLYGAAHREVLHQWRSAYRYRRLVDRMRRLGRSAPPGPDHVVVQGFEVELAQQALMRLRPGDQEVLRLALWEELTHTEIAVVLGVSEQAVGMRFVRAKRRFGDEYRALERRYASPRVSRREATDDE
jgi:RNA polymerase sigma factor (sigma-70 family)